MRCTTHRLQPPLCNVGEGVCNGAAPTCRCEGSNYGCQGAAGAGVCTVSILETSALLKPLIACACISGCEQHHVITSNKPKYCMRLALWRVCFQASRCSPFRSHLSSCKFQQTPLLPCSCCCRCATWTRASAMVHPPPVSVRAALQLGAMFARAPTELAFAG